MSTELPFPCFGIPVSASLRNDGQRCLIDMGFGNRTGLELMDIVNSVANAYERDDPLLCFQLLEEFGVDLTGRYRFIATIAPKEEVDARLAKTGHNSRPLGKYRSH